MLKIKPMLMAGIKEKTILPVYQQDRLVFLISRKRLMVVPVIKWLRIGFS